MIQLPQSHENHQAKLYLDSVISRTRKAGKSSEGSSVLGSPVESFRGREAGRTEWTYAGFSTLSTWESKQVRTRDLMLPSVTWEKEAETGTSNLPPALTPESPSSKTRAQRRWQQASAQRLSLQTPSALSQWTAVQAFVTAFESVAELVKVHSGQSRRTGTGRTDARRQ